MEIDKTLQFDAPPAAVWALLLDPAAMGACVPGMQSIDVLSDDEYMALMQVKISFISAHFKLRTRIVARDAPNYLRAEGTGEDTKVASSLKQTSEMWLTLRPDGGTDLRMNIKVDVFGRVGAFGLSVMKTKADRLWDEFGANAAARLAAPVLDGPVATGAPETAAASTPAAASRVDGGVAAALPALHSPPSAPQQEPAHFVAHSQDESRKVDGPSNPPPEYRKTVSAAAGQPRPGFWARLMAPAAPAGSTDIRVEIRRGDMVINVQWPVQAAHECTAWLRSLDLDGPGA